MLSFESVAPGKANSYSWVVFYIAFPSFSKLVMYSTKIIGNMTRTVTGRRMQLFLDRFDHHQSIGKVVF